MKNLMNKIKKNNKGFTLVELIVVIAVLAIITVVAAPQYIKYVEKSRVGTDENAIGEIAHIAEIAYVELKSDANENNDPVETEAGVCTLTVTIGEGGVASLSDDDNLAEAVTDIMGADSYKFVSKEYTETTPEVEITLTNGIADWDTLSEREAATE